MAAASPRVKLITIDGLFRQYDHRIPLRLDERVTVLHGRNGVGKTVTLSLVAALLQGRYSTLAKVPFHTLRVDFTDGSFLSVRPVKRSERSPADKRTAIQPVEVDFRVGYGKRNTRPKTVLVSSDTGAPQPNFPYGGLYDDPFAANGHYRETTLAGQRSSPHGVEPPGIAEFRRRVIVHFIEAQRLFRFASSEEFPRGPGAEVTSATVVIAGEMAARIQETDSTYRSTSTRLDDSLPARLFAPPKNGTKPAEKDLARRTEALEAERRRLHEIGLLADTTSFNPSELNTTQRAMFAVYLEDNEEKLAVFRDLADRAEILLGILNRKLHPKHIKLDKDEGYKVLTHDGQPLPLDALSSGEQHELVLLHNLLFRVEPGSFLLIDEPELSLHVTWQNEFLSELIQIAKKIRFDALVATHSPYIVGERRDLMVRLGEPV